MTTPRPRNTTPGSWEWAACGASVTGSQHVSRGLGCDDAFCYGLAGDFVVAAVADGAGSVSGTSAWGSYAACRSVLDLALTPEFITNFRHATATDSDHMMRWLFTGALDRVTKQADEMDLPVAQLSTTLCVAIATPELAVFGQIGDGIIAAESNATIATHLIEEKNDYANATWFIQSRGAFDESFRTSAHAGMTAFALSTDGMVYKITNIVTGEAYEPFFKGSWQHVRSGAGAAQFAALLRDIKDDQTGDDKTMVLAALRWADDEFFPSVQPVTTIAVHSAPPPKITIAPAAHSSTPDLAIRQSTAVNTLAPERSRAQEAFAPGRADPGPAGVPGQKHRIVENGELVDMLAPDLGAEQDTAPSPASRVQRPPGRHVAHDANLRVDAGDQKKRRFRPRRSRN